MKRRKPSVKANSIRQKRQVHKGSFLVVEGKDDRLFFEAFVDRDLCSIQVAEGKENVTGLIEILEGEFFPGIVGVVDADFDHIEGRRRSIENLIILETVDMEALQIRSPAFDRILVELGSKSKIAKFGKGVRESLVEAAVWIGCLRLYSHQERLNLKFSGLNYAKCVSRESLEINTTNLVQQVLNNSQRPDLSCEEIVSELESISASLGNPWLISFGKDMVEVLAIGLRKMLGSNDAKRVNPILLSSHLRLAFSRTHLDESELGRDIRRWEERNSGFFVLKAAAPEAIP